MSGKQKSTRDILRDAIASHPGITERELGDLTEFSTSKLTPGRIRLWEAGEIEPTTENGWKQAMVSRVKDVGWQIVEHERREDVSNRARERQKRNARSVEDRARRAAEDLADPVIFRLVQKLTRDDVAGTRAGQRRRERTVRQHEAQRKQEARRAQREKTANADFKKKLALLWDARSTVAAIDQHLIDERTRVAEHQPRKISDIDWVIALRDVVMIIQSFGSIWDNVRDLGENLPCPVCGAPQVDEERHLRPFAIDVEAEEILDVEVVSD